MNLFDYAGIPEAFEKRYTLAPIPKTDWCKPAELPNLRHEKIIALDVETYDPDLKTRGPGWARGTGHIVGIAVGTLDGGRWYLPIRHEVQPEDNLDPSHVLTWAKDHLTQPAKRIVGANLQYDIGWLAQEGVHVRGMLFDVLAAEALLIEYGHASLETVGQKYLAEGKETNQLYQWIRDTYKGDADKRADIYRAPPRLVGHYAQSDVDLPLRLMPILFEKLQEQNLWKLFRVECALIPLLIAMRFQGVRIDLDRATALHTEFQNELQMLQASLAKQNGGIPLDINSAASIAPALDALGIPYGRTPTGKPAINAEFFKGVQHPFTDAICNARELEKLCGTFIEGYMFNSHVEGRLYTQFHPLKSDAGGTKSGRFSSSTPNLQNIPSRSKIGKQLRECFLPEPGHTWRSFDYSQIEYRMLAHFAVGDKADELRAQYNADPWTDYHDWTGELIKAQTGQKLARAYVKAINFGLLYGMGKTTLAKTLGVSRAKGNEIFDTYHASAPFAQATAEHYTDMAQSTGLVRTILGRRARYEHFTLGNQTYTAEEAVRVGATRRVGTHTALNRVLQGSAADLLKIAMLKAWQAGVFDDTGVPLLTVHDELDFSDPGNAEPAFAELKNIMENAIDLNVPVRVSDEQGPTWGECE